MEVHKGVHAGVTGIEGCFRIRLAIINGTVFLARPLAEYVPIQAHLANGFRLELGTVRKDVSEQTSITC